MRVDGIPKGTRSRPFAESFHGSSFDLYYYRVVRHIFRTEQKFLSLFPFRSRSRARGQDPGRREDVPQVSAVGGGRERMHAVTDGKGGKRDQKRRREESVGVGLGRVLETVAAVLPDQFRWTADTNCFSGLDRAVLSLSPSFSLSSLSCASFSRANLRVSIGRKCFQARLFSAIPLFFDQPPFRSFVEKESRRLAGDCGSKPKERNSTIPFLSNVFWNANAILTSILPIEGVAKVGQKIFRFVEIVKKHARVAEAEAAERNSGVINRPLFRG